MLPASQNRAYQDFLTLLTDFAQVLAIAEPDDRSKSLLSKFDRLSTYFKTEVEPISDRQIETAKIPRWQSVQTEILREFKLLSTDLLFLASARQDLTKQKRTKSIKDRLGKLVGYCQIMLKDNI